ncbi:cutinase family protein [Mycobacterium sp. CVI_P3]|uniref:Cutinase n=1 Tax=Mycobacterium pinniadriaticum TaxID=2994102 RepID=A0ABT3SEZ7_9MYCO|nr:cutinase family protein [Mycobacterium pinniadriaticum]MCX2937689.1 cutinase family protein [Mycobacterium pinniadriaticum]
MLALPATVLVALAALVTPTALPTAAADCNDVEVVFARGTDEAPGIGRVGQAFVNSLRGKIGNRSMGVYAVNYPASYDFLAAADGANDASAFIQNVVNTCPNTRLVLGGYSQGAAIIDIITSIPFPAVGFNNPLPPNVPDHVAALAVFGNPTAKVGLPLTSSPVYGSRAIDLCNTGDPICTDGDNVAAHRAYGGDGTASQAASFVASLL